MLQSEQILDSYSNPSVNQKCSESDEFSAHIAPQRVNQRCSKINKFSAHIAAQILIKSASKSINLHFI